MARRPVCLIFTWQTRASGKATSEEHQVDVQPDLHGPVKVATGQGFIRARPEDVLNMVVAIERRPDWDDLCDYASQVRLVRHVPSVVWWRADTCQRI